MMIWYKRKIFKEQRMSILHSNPFQYSFEEQNKVPLLKRIISLKKSRNREEIQHIKIKEESLRWTLMIFRPSDGPATGIIIDQQLETELDVYQIFYQINNPYTF